MFLKKIEITGFKSFAKKTALDFSEGGVFQEGRRIGITAIVGPNGSGKSNVADALRWALGEQSMKNIRGKRSQDIIFAGSGNKAKLGSAQVSIYLDNSKKKIPLDFDEIVITRKIFRSGESEYIINNSRVRLIDIADLLAKAGIGQRSYCIINQGMADQLLNSTPIERRSIIEEAAGVKEFQIKKERSLRKLRSTKNNLERVKGLLIEIEPHLKLLKRQSHKAQKGEQYREEYKQKTNALFGFLWHDLMVAKSRILESKEIAGREMMQNQREADSLLDKLKKESKDTVSVKNKISQLEEKQRKINHRLNLIERELVVEEGKMELERERMSKVEEVEIIPVGVGLIKMRLNEIKTQQDQLIEKIAQTESLDGLQELKEYARAISGEMYDLYESVVRGRIEKRKPTEEIEKIKTLNLRKLHSFMGRIAQLKSKKEDGRKELEKIIGEIEDAVKKDREDRKNAIELEDSLRRKQFELEKLKDKFNESKIELARIEVREEDLSNRIKNEIKVPPEQIPYKGEKINTGEYERDISRLRFHLEQIGGIDDAVIEEYSETQKRNDFLLQESEDLRDAMKKLKKVIKEMDEKIKDRFEEAYSFINKEFNNYFKIIFNGGKAKLSKVEIKTGTRAAKEGEIDDDNNIGGGGSEAAESSSGQQDEEESQIGIEIVAEPPGKKISSLGMLSGGERALASLALLFSIIAHNPPPFAILDEVEAALDEANSKRFGKILKELSGRTQFVVITHNRQTMREAAVLYGVTMGGDGISKLLSVKLDQVGDKGEIKQ